MKPLNAIITPANKKPGAYDPVLSKRKPTIGGPNEIENNMKISHSIHLHYGDKSSTYRERWQCLGTAAIDRMHL